MVPLETVAAAKLVLRADEFLKTPVLLPVSANVTVSESPIVDVVTVTLTDCALEELVFSS